MDPRFHGDDTRIQMLNRIKSNLVFLVLPVMVWSTQTEPTVKTKAVITGTGHVYIENNIKYQSTSNDKINVSSEDSHTINDNNDRIYKKIEIDVNGKKQVVESTESGTTSLNVLGEATASVSVSSEQKPIPFKQEQITTAEYIWEQLQKTIHRIFGGFFDR